MQVRGSTEPIVALIYLFLVLLGTIGWVLNIIAIVHANWDHVTGWLLLRVIGVFLPIIGAIIGWF